MAKPAITPENMSRRGLALISKQALDYYVSLDAKVDALRAIDLDDDAREVSVHEALTQNSLALDAVHAYRAVLIEERDALLAQLKAG